MKLSVCPVTGFEKVFKSSFPGYSLQKFGPYYFSTFTTELHVIWAHRIDQYKGLIFCRTKRNIVSAEILMAKVLK